MQALLGAMRLSGESFVVASACPGQLIARLRPSCSPWTAWILILHDPGVAPEPRCRSSGVVEQSPAQIF